MAEGTDLPANLLWIVTSVVPHGVVAIVLRLGVEPVYGAAIFVGSMV